MVLPKGFKAGGVSCGISQKANKRDLALFLSSCPANVSAMFTSNCIKAAPVIFDMAQVKTNSKIQAIIANSGCANACTGQKGLDNAKQMADSVKKEFALEAGALVCSTGVIGQDIDMAAFHKGLCQLKNSVGMLSENQKDAVLATMTTDTRIKYASETLEIDGKDITIWACTKGSGMIHPDLKTLHATMLSFILTDANIPNEKLNSLLEHAVEDSYNCISVDGDMSTNDTVIILANGQSMPQEISKEGLSVFSKKLDDILLGLAKEMAKDGEGANKLVEITVKGCKEKSDAKKIASLIAVSPLVKTAIYGQDANWGRILASAGHAGVYISQNKVELIIAGAVMFKNGAPCAFDVKAVEAELKKENINIILDLHEGEASSTYYTCDLGHEYVDINALYRS